MAEGRGVPVSELLRGTGLPAETLHDHRQRISWDDWAALVERTQFLLGGPGVLEDAATEITQLSWNRALSSLGRIAWTEVQFLRLVATRIAPAVYPCLDVHCESLGRKRYLFSVRVDASRRDSSAVMRLFAGFVRGVPRMVGQTRWAEMEADVGPRHLRVVLRPLARMGLFRKAARTLAGLVLGNPAVSELERQQRDLRRGYEDLRVAQDRLRVITENAFDLIAEIDERGTIHYASPNFRTILGMDPDRVVGVNAGALLDPDELERQSRRLRNLFAGPGSEHIEARARDAYGHCRRLAVTAKVFESPYGGRRAVLVARDVTRVRAAAEELERRNRSLDTLRAVADALHSSLDFEGTAERIVDAVVANTEFPRVVLQILSDDGKHLEVAAASRAGPPATSLPQRIPVEGSLGGRALAEKRPVWTTREGDCEPIPPQILERYGERCIGTAVVVPLLLHDRAVGTLALAAPEVRTPLADDADTLLALGKTAAAALESARHVARVEREVGERKQAEEALRESETRLRQVTDNVDGVFYLLETDAGRILFLSSSFERVMGVSRQVVLDDPRSFYDAVHPEDRERVRAAFAAAAAGYEIEYRVVRPDGATRTLLDRSYPIRSGDGPVRAAGFAQDVTELRELELQLRHSQKMEAVGRLAGGIAHDFNNLLTVITGYGEVLSEQFDRDDADRQTLDEILQAAERAAALTRQLLTMSRKQPVEVQALDLNQVVADVTAMLRSLLGEEVELRISLAAEPLLVTGDRGQLEQVLVNLVVNARDAMPGGGAVGIRTERGTAPGGQERVRLVVTDTGVGMDPETQARIFEPFFSTKELGQGSGLGLATVYGIVDRASGRIEVESLPGKGSTFVIDLPHGEEGPRQAVAQGARRKLDGKETLLLVEDQRGVRDVGGRILRERGYRVIEAAGAEEALEHVRSAKASIDLLVTDVVMPGMGGPALAARVAEWSPGLPILFLSGYAGSSEGLPLGRPGIGFLAKPFSAGALAAAVRDVLDQSPRPDAVASARRGR